MTLQTRTPDLGRMLRRAPHWLVMIGLMASIIGLFVGLNSWIIGVLALGHEIPWAVPLIGYSGATALTLRLTGLLTARLAGVRP